MSFQLVYASAPRLLDSPGSGYGTVARTEDIPRRLAQKLENISIYKEATASRITGTQYTYQIIEYNGAAYHVLTAVNPAGADYSGRACHIAHHLALTPEEVMAMKSNAMRPTPAGIMLALLKNGFWYTSWHEEPRTLTGEPRLSASSLPDASRQTTWKQLTGHKSNARAFFTHPYERDCLCLVPPGTTSETILLLINESDWLAASRGWGKTFTTHGAEADSFSFTRRIFTTADSPLVTKAERIGKALLDIAPELILPEREVPTNHEEFSTLQQPASHVSPDSTSRQETPPAGLSSPYRYCESQDADTYDLPPKRINWLRVSGLVLGLSILAAGGIFIHQGMPGKHPMGLVWEQPATNADSADAGDPHAGMAAPNSLRGMVARLRALCQAPYDATAAQLTLDQLAAQARQLPFPDSPDASAFLACISSLREAGNLSSDYAAELISLMQFARQFHLSEHQLGRFFMHQVTYARNADEAWFKSLDAEYPRWAFIFSRFPEMTPWLHRDFGAYMDPIINRFASTPPEPTSHRWVQGIVRPNLPLPAWLRDSCSTSAGLSLPGRESITGAAHHPINETTSAPLASNSAPPETDATMGQRPYALIAGQSDPVVRDMVQEATKHPITQGELIIAHHPESNNSPLRLFLDGEHYSLKAESADDGNTRTVTFYLLGPNGAPAADFKLVLTFEGKELRDIRFNGNSPRLVCIPLPTSDQVLHPTVLAQALEIPIELNWAGIKPPVLPLNRFKFYASPNRNNEIRFGQQPLPGIAAEDAYQLPDIELQLQQESSVCIPSIGYICHFEPIRSIRIGNNRYTIDFSTVPNQHKEFDIIPEVTCSVNFQEFLVRQLAQLSRSYPLKDGQVLPLADLYFAAQEFEQGEKSRYPAKRLAQLYIDATRQVESVSAYRFFENHIGLQFLALHGDSEKVKQIFDTPLKARFVQNRIRSLLSDTLITRFETYFREYLSNAPSIRLTLKLRRIDVTADTLQWSFEPVLPDSSPNGQQPAHQK